MEVLRLAGSCEVTWQMYLWMLLINLTLGCCLVGEYLILCIWCGMILEGRFCLTFRCKMKVVCARHIRVTTQSQVISNELEDL